MERPTTMKAMLPDYAGDKSQLQEKDISIPSLESNQVLVKISYVAQNPTDVQSLDSKAFGDQAVYGCDFVGEVVECGAKVTRVQVGDVIAALVWGGEIKGVGAYSQFTVADEKICFKVPQGLKGDSASSIPLALTTAWLALFSKSCLNMDRSKPQDILIWGGSSSVGQFAIQIAAMYNFNIVATCSPSNFGLVKSFGATSIFNYKDDDIVEKIQSAAPRLTSIFDTIGNSTSSEIASKTVTVDKGALCTVRPGKANTEKVSSHVEVTDVLVWTAFLKEHRYGEFVWPPSDEDHSLCSELYDNLPQWIQSGKIKPNNTLVLQGLDAVNEGFDMYRNGKISAKKVVYKI